MNSKSGYSGAGKGLKKNLSIKSFNSTFAYNVNNHRHMREIDQEFYKITKIKLIILLTHICYHLRYLVFYITNTKGKMKAEKIRNELKRFYKKSKFIKF